MFPETKPKGRADDVIFAEGANALRARAPCLGTIEQRYRTICIALYIPQQRSARCTDYRSLPSGKTRRSQGNG